MGFPLNYPLNPGPGHWRPTSTIAQQQTPLLPGWGGTRTFVMPSGEDLRPAAAAALQLSQGLRLLPRGAGGRTTSAAHLTDEQKAIARFWSDDAMLSTTPPGHWIQIAFQLFERESTPIDKRVDLLARLGVVTADAFIACWATKFEYDVVRPVTYIRANIDPELDAAPDHARRFPNIRAGTAPPPPRWPRS